MEVTRLYNMAVRWSVNVEANMVSIQRLLELTRTQAERGGLSNIQGEASNFSQLKLGGKIEFKQVYMSYKPDLEPALKNLSF